MPGPWPLGSGHLDRCGILMRRSARARGQVCRLLPSSCKPSSTPQRPKLAAWPPPALPLRRLKLRARARSFLAPQGGAGACADDADKPAPPSRRCATGPAQTRRAFLNDGLDRLGTPGAPSACNLTCEHHLTLRRPDPVTWSGGAADQVSCNVVSHAARSTLTPDARVRTRQALSLSLRRVCAVPNCAKSGCSLHAPTTVCRAERCPLLSSMGAHSVLLEGCLGGDGKQQRLWSSGAHSVSAWFDFPDPTLLSSRVDLPADGSALLGDLHLHVRVQEAARACAPCLQPSRACARTDRP